MFKVTVAVCCYKQEEWLFRCLRSLANQTLPKSDFEVIVCNDNPAVPLDDIIDKMKPHLNIRLLNNDVNLGLPGSLNKIVKSALGRFFVIVDCDDYVSRHFLSMLTAYLEVNHECQAVFCDYTKVNFHGKKIGRFDASKDFIACGIMMDYEALCAIGAYDDNFKMREGHDLHQRFSEKYKIEHLKVPLYRYRMHIHNRSENISEVAKYDEMLSKENSKPTQKDENE